MITHQPSTMNTSREPRLKSPYPPTTHHILQYHWTPSNKTNPRPHRHNQVKNHQPWLNPPIHHNSHTTLTNKPESLPNQPLIETKDNQLKTITIAHHEITYRITHNITNKPIPTQSPFTTPWEPTVKAIKTIMISPIKFNSRLTDYQPMNHTTKTSGARKIISKPPPDHQPEPESNQHKPPS